MKKFKELVIEIRKFKLPRGEQEIDSYMEKGAKGKKVPVVIAKKSNKFKVYVDGQELAQYKNEKEARKNAKQIIENWNNDLANIARLNRENLNYLKITEKQITDLIKKIHSTSGAKKKQ